MLLWFIRIFFLLAFSFIGHEIGSSFGKPFLGFILGITLGLWIIFFEIITRRISLRGLSQALFGLFLGLVMARIIIEPFRLLPLQEAVISTLRVVFTFVFSYLGITLAIRGKDDFHIVIPYVRFKRQDLKEENYILDTSVIIDGRIQDIIKTGFLGGKLIIPRFVLTELQKIADSTEPLKRQRGRRGVEILNSLKSTASVEIKIHEEEVPELKDTDAKLVRLAQILEGQILTTDYNLNRIAELQGVKVLNINDLANALKPVFLPGERLSIKLIREGKEYKQAVGYLEDGTMVVVENARSLIGQTVDTVVSSVLQTPAGRIIFTKLA